jgi:hypothetical protein
MSDCVSFPSQHGLGGVTPGPAGEATSRYRQLCEVHPLFSVRAVANSTTHRRLNAYAETFSPPLSNEFRRRRWYIRSRP